MKKQYLLMAAFASAMAFTACSNDDDLGITPGNLPSEEVVPEGKTIDIAISNTGEGTTKASRPVTSSAANNNVNRVQLVIWSSTDGSTWKQETISATEPIGWDTAADDEAKEELVPTGLYIECTNAGEEGANMSASIGGLIQYSGNATEGVPGDVDHINKKATLRVWGLDADQMYRITAYGYHTSDNVLDVTEIKEGSDSKFYWKLTNDDQPVQEVFTDTYVTSTTEVENEDGSKSIYFAPKPSLELTRQVAGMLAYFENVPAFSYNDVTAAYTKIAKISIVANKTMSNFYFPNVMLGEELVVGTYGKELYNGIASTIQGENEQLLMTFDMAKIAHNYNSVKAPNQAGDGETAVLYTFDTMVNGVVTDLEGQAENAVAPVPEEMTAGYASAGLTLKENTIFGGRFLLPYDKHYASQTLSVVFYDEDGTELERKPITCTTQGYNTYHYDILCNNFYSIGQKLGTGDTEGPGEGEEDDDKPESLSGNEIPLRINDAWDVLHNMGIE